MPAPVTHADIERLKGDLTWRLGIIVAMACGVATLLLSALIVLA